MDRLARTVVDQVRALGVGNRRALIEAVHDVTGMTTVEVGRWLRRLHPDAALEFP